MTPFQERIRGIIPAILTALDEKFAVDPQAMRRSARRLLDNGCQGVVVVGTSGEFAGIDDDQRPIAIRAVVEELSGQAPVIVGCGQPNVRRTHEQAQQAADLGADGLLVNPPFYFPMSQDEVVRFFAELVASSPLPVLLYNIPGLTNVAVEPATIPRLRDVGVQGTKDSSGIPANTLAYLDAREGGVAPRAAEIVAQAHAAVQPRSKREVARNSRDDVSDREIIRRVLRPSGA